MFLFLSRIRYGPLVQVAAGLVFVIIGLFVLTRVLLTAGGLLIVWGIATGIGHHRARNRQRDESSAL